MLFISGGKASDISSQQVDAVKAISQQVKALSQKMPENAQKVLSGGIQNLINLSDQISQREGQLLQQVPSSPTSASASLIKSLPPGSVSEPSIDVAFSRFSGFTQNETSTAQCGNTVVVGFNDSGSFFQTGFLSFNGVSRSTDNGASFTDEESPTPGLSGTFLSGDPVLGCSSANNFYYASLFDTPFQSAISVSTSVNAGLTFFPPVIAATKDIFTHILDKPWMAVDPTTIGPKFNTTTIYVTYTDFDSSGTSATCGSLFRTAIELVKSIDGGATWSGPVVIAEACAFPPPISSAPTPPAPTPPPPISSASVQGSQVVIGPTGVVYVAWESFAADFVTRQIDFRSSEDGGSTFGPTTKVSDVTFVGSTPVFSRTDLLQGAFRNSEFPSLAVDRSNNNIYVSWNDGSLNSSPDFFLGTYNFADIFVSKSIDGGATFSPPVLVNDNTETPGAGTDQYQPGIAVDKNGVVGVCFYDRRNDANNFLIDRFCAGSEDGGATWTNAQITSHSFAPVPGQDFLVVPTYMGDYDSLASDFIQINSGFIGAFGDNTRGNPDVRSNIFSDPNHKPKPRKKK